MVELDQPRFAQRADDQDDAGEGDDKGAGDRHETQHAQLESEALREAPPVDQQQSDAAQHASQA